MGFETIYNSRKFILAGCSRVITNSFLVAELYALEVGIKVALYWRLVIDTAFIDYIELQWQ